MKYFRIKIQLFYPNNRIASTAVGDKIPNIGFYFNKLKNGEIITDAPPFDYFYLESYDIKKYWEWRLFDVHDLRAAKIHIPAWLVSIDLKNILCKFSMPQPSFFYPSKILYKGEKFENYIFQFTGQNIIDKMRIKYIQWIKSIFLNPTDKSCLRISSMEDFIHESRRILKESNYSKEVKLQKLVLNEFVDFFPMGTFLNDDIISESLKQAIEDAGITGFEFSELDYDVVVEE